MTWQEYETGLEERKTADLSQPASTVESYRGAALTEGSLHTEDRRAETTVERVAALEDKIVQQAVVTILESDL